MSVGSFILIKNEITWIKQHLDCWLPWLDEMCFLDGCSTDGTLEVLREYANTHPQGHKIILKENKDPKDLKDDYVRLFNEALRSLSVDWAFFLHPDMACENPEAIRDFEWKSGIAAYTSMRSFAGEPGGEIKEIVTGRAEKWKNLFRHKNPDLGLHYHGWYGSADEDCYFREITGDEHKHHGEAFHRYPYHVFDSGLKLLHFSDVRPYERRLDRMIKCLEHQGYGFRAAELAKEHPRVTLQDGKGFKFVPYNAAVAA